MNSPLIKNLDFKRKLIFTRVSKKRNKKDKQSINDIFDCLAPDSFDILGGDEFLLGFFVDVAFSMRKVIFEVAFV